jgi:hypothetical protein
LKYSFPSARVIRSTSARLPDDERYSPERTGNEKFLRRLVSHFLSEAQKAARVKASREVLRILQDSEQNNFGGIVTGDESWFRYLYPYSKMFARSPAEVLPRIRQGIDTKEIMVTIFLTARKRIVLDVLPKGRKFSQLSFLDSICPD